jgi:hypothetical protein
MLQGDQLIFVMFKVIRWLTKYLPSRDQVLMVTILIIPGCVFVHQAIKHPLKVQQLGKMEVVDKDTFQRTVDLSGGKIEKLVDIQTLIFENPGGL